MEINKYRIIIIMAALLTLSAIVPAFAKNLEHPMNVTATLSTDKYVKQNSPVPVTVDIFNMGGDFNGRIALLSNRSYKQEDYNQYFQDIQVPANGQKRFYLYIPISSYYTADLTLRISSGKDFRDEKVQYTLAQNYDTIISILNKQKGGLAYLTGYKSIIPPNSSIYVTYPDPQKLPVLWHCYRNIDILFINDLPSLNLDNEREKAILDYVRSGGSLVFSTNLDPGEFNGSLFREYLPLIPQSTQVVGGDTGKAFNAASTVVMSGKLNGTIMGSIGNSPVLLQKKIGEGNIFFIAVDLSKKPFKETYEEKEIWGRIFSARSNWNPTIDKNNVLANQPEMASPPLSAIFWSLFFYILLIGPVNYFVLKKKDKLMYLFATVPIIAILFSLGIFATGYSIKGSSIIVRKFNIVYMRNEQSSSVIDTVFSIFSPNKTSYNVKFSDPSSVAWEMGNTYDLPQISMKEGSNLELENIAIQMWNMRQFSSAKVHNFDGSLTLKINAANDKFEGKIINNTGKTIKSCVLFSRGNLSSAFDLPPGEKQISMAFVSKGMVVVGALNQNLSKIWGLDNPDTRRNIPLSDAKQEVLGTLSDNMLRAGSDLIMVGWNEDDLTDISLNRKSPRFFNTNLFYVR